MKLIYYCQDQLSLFGFGIEADTQEYSTGVVSSELNNSSLGWRQVVIPHFTDEERNVGKVTARDRK